MDLNLLFQFLSFAPGPFWLILIFAPKNSVAMSCFDAFLFFLSLIFTIQTIPAIPELLPAIASPTLPVIQGFLGSVSGTVGAWNHMILADLWIGRWVCHDAIRLDIPLFIRIPVLAVILFFGPLGLCLYLIIRFLLKKELRLVGVGEHERS